MLYNATLIFFFSQIYNFVLLLLIQSLPKNSSIWNDYIREKLFNFCTAIE